MNWYFKIILSQVLTDVPKYVNYLNEIGTKPEVIDYLLNLDQKQAQKLINVIRQNPNITLNEIQLLSTNQPKNIDPYLKFEKDLVLGYPSEMLQWILVNFRKIRKGNMGPFNSVTDIVKKYPDYSTFYAKLPEIKDWFNYIHPNIASYNALQAIQASDEWHEKMAEEGENLKYDATNSSNIKYGPNWKNKEFNGWTIQRVISDNDLKVEGNLMNHCVGSYCESVKRGDSIIYSLRDPSNKPHVTIETSNANDIEQIKGKSNSEPKDEYKKMIKEWFTSINKENHIVFKYSPNYDGDNEENITYTLNGSYTNDIDEMVSAIEKIGMPDDYGLILSNVDIEPQEILENIVEKEKNNSTRYRRYDNDIIEFNSLRQAIYALFSYIFRKNTYNQPTSSEHKLYNMKNEKIDQKGLYSDIYYVEKYLYELQDEATQMVDDWIFGSDILPPMPQEEEYETPEDFEEAIKNYEEYEQETYKEAFTNSVDGYVASEGFKYLEELRKENKIPSFEEMKKYVSK